MFPPLLLQGCRARLRLALDRIGSLDRVAGGADYALVPDDTVEVVRWEPGRLHYRPEAVASLSVSRLADLLGAALPAREPPTPEATDDPEGWPDDEDEAGGEDGPPEDLDEDGGRNGTDPGACTDRALDAAGAPPEDDETAGEAGTSSGFDDAAASDDGSIPVVGAPASSPESGDVDGEPEWPAMQPSEDETGGAPAPDASDPEPSARVPPEPPRAGDAPAASWTVVPLPNPELAERVLQWVLRRGGARQVSLDYRRPPRRAPHLLGIVPAIRRPRHLPRVHVLLDTSGSMIGEPLDCATAVVEHLRARLPVTVTQFDAQVRRVVDGSRIRTVVGGGGSDLSGALTPAHLRTVSPFDVLVLLTDGEILCPATPPAWPTLWCLVGTTPNAPVGWGEVLSRVSRR